MASKQLGKLRQWAGEVISVRDKTAVSDEFRDLEVDIELRRRGLWRLFVSSEDYRNSICKKKESEALEGDEKLLPIESLGLVMIQHGEEFGEDSAFGTSLVSLGKAHCRISTLQESYATTLSETFIASIQRAQDEIKEYQSQRKKLESRRLTFDAATTKLEKMRKSKKEKEKEREEAEDEYEKAQSRYEETSEDVRARMYAIQENEVEQLRELTNFLQHEIHFVEQYLEVLKDAKKDWIDEETLVQMENSRTKRPSPRPVSDSRYSSVRSIKSIARSGAGSDEVNSDDESRTKPRRTKSISGTSSRAPSRPQSRASRKRSDSIATSASGVTEKDKDEGKEKDKEKEKEKEKSSKRRSVAGWLTGRGNKKDKEKSAGESLMADRDDINSDEEEPPAAVSRSASFSRMSPTKIKSALKSTPDASPRPPSRNLKPTPVKKLVVALHDYASTSSDELSFRAGDQIVVVNEVLEGWWMGLLNGQTGLFPTNYTEVLNSSTSSLVPAPPLPRRPSPTQNIPSSLSRLDNKPKPKWLTPTDTGNSATSDFEEHPFGDTYIASRSPLNGAFYAESISSDMEDYDAGDRQTLVQGASDGEEHITQDTSSPPTVNSPPQIPIRGASVTSAARKAPPPPPPRRSATAVSALGSVIAPAIPSRPGMPRSFSSSQATTTTAAPVGNSGEELTFSPFDSPKDSTFAGGCRDFKQNPFKPRGTCNNCFQIHVDRM